ncbi:unnamed protein product [Polarella glacialis]|uniref:Uncharacterized protein n=1 Tax=Polarella glacialis TaxID=89957 RepID=A0A813DH68_POLGL|nr:unnamed protein product [Polarella glacialis]
MLTNSDLAAVAAMIPRLDRLETVDLSGCDGIVMDDGVLTSLLRRLHGFPAGPTLKQLCLAGCRGAGREVVVEVVSLLKSPTGCRQLLSLDLNAIAVPGSLATALCEAARAHPTLRSVSLASTRLGSDAASRRAITELLGAAKLESLDLSWNCFPLEVFQSIGEAVNKSLTLQHLRLSNCTGCRAALGEAPCTSFLEKIAGGASALKTLDLSANLLNSAGALVLEDALERHAGLQELNVSQNSLGTTGLRSILRLLGSDSCGLQSIDCSDCASCGEEQGGSEGGSTLLAGSGSHFNAANPCGRYELDFSRSCDRAALRQLYKLCQRARLAPDKAFRDQEFSEGPLSHPSAAGSGGVWPVPDSGKLQATFGIEAALPDYFPAPKAPAEAESTAGRSFLRRCLGEGLLRTKPSQRKLAALLSKWAAASHNDDKEEQLLLLDAFSRGFQLDFPALKLFLSSSARPKEALARLLHCAAVETSHLQLLYTLTSGLDEHLSLYRSCRQLLHFDPENPTGRYKLDLRNTADYALAESLMALDRWESAVAQREGRADCSRNGDWSNIRNCSHGGAAIRKVREWHLHDWGSLSLDYVTWRRPTPGASELALPWRDWQRFLQTLTEGCADADDLLASLRAVSGSGGLFLFSWQLRELLGLFRHEKHRVECMVISYLRLVDPQNAKILRARIQNLSEFKALALRLGRSSFSPRTLPSNSTWGFSRIDLQPPTWCSSRAESASRTSAMCLWCSQMAQATSLRLGFRSSGRLNLCSLQRES